MSKFAGISNSIANLERQQNVSIDDLLKGINCFIDDVLDSEKAEEIDELSITNRDEFVKDAQRLANSLCELLGLVQNHSYSKAAEIEKISNDKKEELKRLRDELVSINGELTVVADEVRKNEQKMAEIKDKRDDIFSHRSHLLDIKDKCEELEREITELTNPKLDEMQDTLLKLEAQKDELERKISSLQDECLNLNTLISQRDQKNQELEGQKEELGETLDDRERKEHDLSGEIAEMQAKLTAAEKTISEYENWKAQFPERSKKIDEQANEYRAEMDCILNAVNASRNDTVLESFANGTGNAGLEIIPQGDIDIAGTHFDKIGDLYDWFDKMKERIDMLTKAYTEQYGKLISAIEKMESEAF